MTPPDVISDGDLALRALRGEDHAFTQLMRRHKEALYRFVRRYVGDGDAAYDVVQESFVAAWRNLARYDGARPFATWLRAIAINKCRDRARREAVRGVIFGRDTDEALSTPDLGPGAEAALISAQKRAALDRAVAALPRALKEPLILTAFEGLSHQAAAEVLGVSAKTIETRVYRARRRLAESLGLPENEGGA